jgi:hypothetical protein
MNTCPISTLKAHSLGATYAPFFIQGRWQLKNNAGDVLIGYRGNSYAFKSEKNAQTWLCSNLSRWLNAEEDTDSAHMIKLSKIYSYYQAQYIIDEIEAILSYQRGEWVVKECAGSIEYVEVEASIDYDGGNANGIII